jgi:hypothetical protein
MNFELLIVLSIIACACIYGGVNLWRKTKSFTNGKDCGVDCGCGKNPDREGR